MAYVSQDVENFWSKVLKFNLWNAYRVRSYLFRKSVKEHWKIVVLRTELIRDGHSGVQELLREDRVRMMDEVCNIDSLKKFLTQIASKADLGSKSFVSLELMKSELKYDFKQRTNVRSDYGINYPCFILTAFGKRTDSLEEVEHNIESMQSGVARSYLNIKDACKRLLDVDYGHAYPPNIAILAPIPVKIEKTEFSNKEIRIIVRCSSNFQIDDLKLKVYGFDKYGQQDSYFDDLHLEHQEIIENTFILTYGIEGDFSSDALKLVIMYMEEFV